MAIPLIVRLVGEKAAVAVTLTVPVPGVKPIAKPVMVAEPMLMPLICGCVAGVVWPAAMVTLAGVMVTFELSLEDSVTVVPPAGAAADKATENVVD